MANSNNWGEIYKSTWWGDEEWSANSLFIDSAPAGFGFTGLLDDFSGAAAAYSVRKLSSTYEGNCIRVRKQVSSSPVHEDIGFVNNELDTAALLAFAADADNGDVFVHTWYDQAGNNDATNAAAANQPQIVSSGAVVLENGKPCLDFDGTSDYLSLGGTEDAGMLGDISVFSVNKATAAGDVLVATGLTGSSVASLMQWALSTSTLNRYFAEVSDGTTEGDVFVTASSFGSQSLITMINDETANTTLFADGVAGTPVATKAPMNDANYPLEIGRDPYRINNPSFYFTGTMQELVMYASAQSSNNRLDIEENIANHFGITLP
jgi:hypothetical protein